MTEVSRRRQSLERARDRLLEARDHVQAATAGLDYEASGLWRELGCADCAEDRISSSLRRVWQALEKMPAYESFPGDSL